MSDVFFNGRLMGTIPDAKLLAETIRKKRRESLLPNLLNVRYIEAEDAAHIFLERNRMRRPLIIVEDGKSKLTQEHIDKLKNNEMKWDDLIRNGIVEYLDAAEEEDTFIALKPEEVTKEHTHLEIDTLTIFGLTTALVPFANFNQSSRLNAGQKMQKQAIGLYALNYPIRSDTGSNLLHYPQRSIVQSFPNKLLNKDLAIGQQFVVAILNYEYNMSDAIVINQASVDRGLARITHFKPYPTQRLRYSGGQVDEICIPDKDIDGYTREHDYRLLDEDGIISPELEVSNVDVLIGKTSPPRFLGKIEAFSTAANIRKDASIRLRSGDSGVINKVVITEAEDGSMLIRAEVRDNRPPEIGDKFASRHGQKGVVGTIVQSADMPFTAQGVIPDLIFSPNGLPRRMTAAHLIEALGGKVGALAGRYIDGTPFSSEESKNLRNELLQLGFREDGTETLYDGRTGKEYPARIFVGNIYYLRLKYQVADKLQFRSRGPVTLLTHQPTEGRAREGGLRLGEMEKDAFVAHGASLLLKERFDSDKEIVWVCERCGTVAVHDEYKNKSYCTCGEKTKINSVEMSHAFKLFLDELKAMHIRPRLILKDKY